MSKYFVSAYVQGDWTASEASRKDDPKYPIPALKEKYNFLLDSLEKHGIENMATWHHAAVGVDHKYPASDVLRNTRQIDAADVMITYLQDENHPRSHWGSLAMIGYAVGKGKPCLIVGYDDVFRSHMLHHPLIQRFQTVEDLIAHLTGSK